MANKKRANRKWKIGLKSSAFAMALLLAISQVGIVAFAEDETGQGQTVETTESEGGGTNEAQTVETTESEGGGIDETQTSGEAVNEVLQTTGETEPGESGKATSGKELGEEVSGGEIPTVEPEQEQAGKTEEGETSEENTEEKLANATSGVIFEVNKELGDAIEDEVSGFEDLTVEELEELAAEGQFTADDLEKLIKSGSLTEEEIESLRAVIEEYNAQPEEEELVSFAETKNCNGVNVTLEAPAGVFPKGAYFEVKSVNDYEEENIEEALEVVREESDQVKDSYKFDITVYNKAGVEIEPNTEYGNVTVTFAFEEAADKNLEAKVYHIEGKGENLSVEELESSVDGSVITTETNSFSYYTVEFTYDGELRYVLDGDSKVALSTILEACELANKGEVSDVESSDETLFEPVNEDGVWYIKALQPFETEEWLKVTLGGTVYTIVVTDSVDRTFSDLKQEIADASEGSGLTLYGNRIYDDQKDGAVNYITIDKNISLNFQNNLLDRTSSQHPGRALWIAKDKEVTIKNCVIRGAKTKDDGAGIYVAEGVKLTLENVVFEENSSVGYRGGAISIGKGATVKLTNCKFVNNKAEDYTGGAIYIWGDETKPGNCELYGCDFQGNSANVGAAITINNGSTLLAKDCDFIGNIGSSIIKNNCGKAYFENVNIKSNEIINKYDGVLTIDGSGDSGSTTTSFKNDVNIVDNVCAGEPEFEPGLYFYNSNGVVDVSELSPNSKIAVSGYVSSQRLKEYVLSGELPSGFGNNIVYSTDSKASIIIKDNHLVWQIKEKPTPPKPDPEPDPDPDPTPKHSGHSSHHQSSSSVPVTAQPIVTETGLLAKRYVSATTAGVMSAVPLPFVAGDVNQAGWTTINEVLTAFNANPANAGKPLTVNMNGFVTVDNELIKNANAQKVDLAFNLDNSVSVKLPKQNNILSDALAASPDGAGVFFKVSALTQNDTAELANKTTGLNFADVLAIGGTANTPVVKILTSSAETSLGKGKTLEIEFDTNLITDEAGNKIYKPGQNIYLYNGSDVAGVACYKAGKVGADGKAIFEVPTTTSLWTVAPMNVGKKLFKL